MALSAVVDSANHRFFLANFVHSYPLVISPSYWKWPLNSWIFPLIMVIFQFAILLNNQAGYLSLHRMVVVYEAATQQFFERFGGVSVRRTVRRCGEFFALWWIMMDRWIIQEHVFKTCIDFPSIFHRFSIDVVLFPIDVPSIFHRCSKICALFPIVVLVFIDFQFHSPSMPWTTWWRLLSAIDFLEFSVIFWLVVWNSFFLFHILGTI